MKHFVIANFAMIIFSINAFGQNTAPDSEVLKIDANTEKGFSYPYYLYVPSALRETAQKDKLHSFLVIPNNTGQISDDFAFHEADVKRKLPAIGPFMKTNGIVAPLLMPVFPRPATEYRIYTQSLDRDSMLTDKKEFSRFDLQLIAMIKDAQARLKKDGIKTEKKVLMQGYSASGMFVNRFVFLHPHLVKAAIVGSPGGWALAPVSTFGKKALTFPVGTYDLKEISGKKFDLKALRTVPLFFILGGSDTNDAVPKGDAYDRRETDLVMELFGKTPVERFPVSQRLYSEAGLNAEFKLYPNTPHQMSKEMRDDQIAFLKKHVLN